MPIRNITLGSRLRSKVRIIRKITTKDNGKAAITVDPKNPETRFYTKVEKNQFNLPSRITHMTPEAHRILKENPELPNFLKQELSQKGKRIDARLETKNGIFILRDFENNGLTNNGTFSLWYMDKKTITNKTYFIKRYPNLTSWGNAEAEFLAVKEIERLGFNIIKPQFAITDIAKTPNIIIYDYTNLLSYPQAVIKKKISGSEILKIEETFTKLVKSPALKNLNDFHTFTYRVSPNKNVFVERLPNGKLKLYFTDIYWEEEAYKRKREEYL